MTRKSCNDWRMNEPSLRKLRIESGRTLEQVAKSAGVSTSALSRAERGAVPRPCNIKGIADAYGVTPKQLIDAIFAENAILAIPQGGVPHVGGAPGASVADVTQTAGRGA